MRKRNMIIAKMFVLMETMVTVEVTMSKVFTEEGFFVVHLQIFVSNMIIIRETVIT